MCKVLAAYFKDVSSPAAKKSKMLLYIYTNETGGHGHLLFAMCCIDMVLMMSGKISESGMEKKVS